MPVIGGLFGSPTTGAEGSGELGFEAGEDLVEENLPAGLVALGGVVSLAEEDGDEFGAGLEVGALSQMDSKLQSSSTGRRQ